MLHTVSAKHGCAQICTNQHFYNTSYIIIIIRRSELWCDSELNKPETTVGDVFDI